MRRLARSSKCLLATLLVSLIALTGAIMLQHVSDMNEAQPLPTRVATTSQPNPTVAMPTPVPVENEMPKISATPTSDIVSSTAEPEQKSLTIAASDILKVEVLAVGIDIAVSGETQPRKTERCKGAEECIDPPVFDQAAWYGAVPAVPSTDTVRLFAHTGQSLEGHNSFNNLPAVMAGDEIVVTTETGTFTYRAEDPVLVPYKEVPYSWFIWGDDQVDRVILITCNNQADSATVVEAWLVSAEAL